MCVTLTLELLTLGYSPSLNSKMDNIFCKGTSLRNENVFITYIFPLLVPARIVAISASKTYQLMDNVTLTCSASGDPFPLVKWKHIVNDTILLKEPKFVFSNKNQSLTIQNITLKEQGTYVCTVNNPYAVDEKNVTVFVEGKLSIQNSKYLLLIYLVCSVCTTWTDNFSTERASAASRSPC